MKEAHMKGVATHHGPESWAGVGNGAGQALTGEGAGRVLSSDINESGVPRLLTDAEGKTSCDEIASCTATPRSRRPRARADAPCTRTGRSPQPPMAKVPGRSGKPCGRNPDVNAARKSDIGIVPMIAPNKSAERTRRCGREGR